jgi:hypothetical protein
VSFLGFSHTHGGRHVNFAAFTDAGTEERVAIVREAAARRLASIELNAVVQHVAVTASSRRVAEKFARDWRLSVEDVFSSPYVLIGSIEAIANALESSRERYGFSYWVVLEDTMEAFAPVVSRLSGS